ncbi:hypothetical protein [Kribbella sp. NPDC006257]|uniref:hypothetical protein n=1 Tax=Kribbella sp. NPDC006257 TaxID=3156738 RepID=UPI0033B13BF7
MDADEVGALIGLESEGPGSGPVWSRDLVEDSGAALDRQFDQAESFIHAHLEGLKRLPSSAEIALLVSWTPAAGQDGLCVPARLVKAMSEVGAYLLIDTYSDD